MFTGCQVIHLLYHYQPRAVPLCRWLPPGARGPLLPTHPRCRTLEWVRSWTPLVRGKTCGSGCGTCPPRCSQRWRPPWGAHPACTSVCSQSPPHPSPEHPHRISPITTTSHHNNELPSKDWKHPLLPASPLSRPPEGSCTPSPARPSGSPSGTPRQSGCYPGVLSQVGKVSEGASSCWCRCGCASGSPNTGWSYSPGSAPPLWGVPRWRSRCCPPCTSRRRERGPVRSEPGRGSSSAPGGGAPARSGRTAGCRIHRTRTRPRLNPRRRSSPDSRGPCSFLYLQQDPDRSSQPRQVRTTQSDEDCKGNAAEDTKLWLGWENLSPDVMQPSKQPTHSRTIQSESTRNVHLRTGH